MLEEYAPLYQVLKEESSSKTSQDSEELESSEELEDSK